MDSQTERFTFPELGFMSTKALGEWILLNAASQGEWPMTAHQEFLDKMSNKINDAVDEQISLVLPADAPSDPIFRPAPATVACSTELAPFEHAVDVDSAELNIRPDPALLARGKQLCSQCPVRLDCLATGVQSLALEDGLYGGLLKQERQPIWRQNFHERVVQLRRAYAPVSEALFEFIKKSDQKDQLHNVLIILGRQLATFCADKDANATRQLDSDLRELVASPVISERVQWLLPSTARTIARHWAAACQEPSIDPFQYDFKTPTWSQAVQRAERLVVATLRELATGEFNYRRWNNRLGLSFHNPITFLITIGEPVPDGDIATLKQIGRAKVNLLPPTQRRRIAKIQDFQLLLTEYYGLGESDPAVCPVLAMKYGVSEFVIQRLVSDSTTRIKILCGNLEENEDEEL